jgi:glycosyltransferase involved in cell wall biosynthesis
MSGTVTSGLRYAIVHDWLAVHGGAEETLREICGLYDGTLFTSQLNPSRFPWLEGRAVRTSFVQRLPLAFTKHYVYAPFMPRIYRRFDLSEFDVVLTDSHSFAHAVRKRPNALHVCYYYTPARSLWTPEIDDRAGGGPLAPVKRIMARRMKTLDLEASRGPDVLFAISNTTAERIERFYGRKVDRVIYPPVDTEKWADVQRESDSEGLLVWGRLIQYKRFDLAIEAARRTGQKLQIVGTGPVEAQLKEQARGNAGITFHGRLLDDDLKALMARCRAVLFPGYEDFGIVPVEAMAAGLPVVAYGVGGAAETVLPECGAQFHEPEPGALAAAIESLADRTFDPESLKRHAAKFSRDRFCREYREAVDEAVARHFGDRRG